MQWPTVILGIEIQNCSKSFSGCCSTPVVSCFLFWFAFLKSSCWGLQLWSAIQFPLDGEFTSICIFFRSGYLWHSKAHDFEKHQSLWQLCHAYPGKVRLICFVLFKEWSFGFPYSLTCLSCLTWMKDEFGQEHCSLGVHWEVGKGQSWYWSDLAKMHWQCTLVEWPSLAIMVRFPCFCSVCSGLVAALMGTPADVVKTRVMNQPTKEGK